MSTSMPTNYDQSRRLQGSSLSFRRLAEGLQARKFVVSGMNPTWNGCDLVYPDRKTRVFYLSQFLAFRTLRRVI